MPEPDYIRPANMRTDMDQVPGQREAQRRIVGQRNLLFAAWNSLDLFDKETVDEFLAPQLAVLCGNDGVAMKRVTMVVLMFAIVAVEADRIRNDRSDF